MEMRTERQGDRWLAYYVYPVGVRGLSGRYGKTEAEAVYNLAKLGEHKPTPKDLTKEMDSQGSIY